MVLASLAEYTTLWLVMMTSSIHAILSLSSTITRIFDQYALGVKKMQMRLVRIEFAVVIGINYLLMESKWLVYA